MRGGESGQPHKGVRSVKCVICSAELKRDGPDPELCWYCYKVLRECFCGHIRIVEMIKTLATRIYMEKKE